MKIKNPHHYVSKPLTYRHKKVVRANLVPSFQKRSFASGSVLEPFFYAGQLFQGEPRILFIDIETSPVRGRSWGIYDTNIIYQEEETKLLSVAYRWNHERTTKVLTLPDFKGYKPGVVDDRLLTIEVWKLLDACDVAIAHNGDKFDIRKINGRFFVHGLMPPRPYITIDTLKVARKFLGLDSNKMNDICRLLGIGEKFSTHGIDTWMGCINGIKKAWKEMRTYNAHDVDLLVLVFERLLPWIMWKPNKKRAITAKSVLQ